MPAHRFDLANPAARASRVTLRRGIGLVLGTLLLPGSAQLQGGNRTVGRVALRIWAVLLTSLVLLAVTGLLWRGALVTLLASGALYKLLQPLVIALGVGEAYLIIDAWRIAQPLQMDRRRRLGFGIASLVTALAVLAGSIGLGQAARAQGDLLDTVLRGGGNSTPHQGRYNILMLGADAGADRVGLRADSIMVASVDDVTGRTVMLSLPRNLEGVRFPASSPLREKYPQGYECPDHSCMLNAIYTLGTDNADLYPGVDDPGLQAMREAVSETLGLGINYTIMVDLAGFSSVIDAVGGIRLDINKRVPIGGGTSPIRGWIEPGKDVHLDGYHALWFARSREGSSDFERMVRQKCVVNAMLQQLDPVTVMTRFTDIASAGRQVAFTDVPSKDVNKLATLSARTRKLPIMSVSFTPPLVYPGNPKYDVIRRVVAQKIAASEALDAPRKAPSASAPRSRAQTPRKPDSSRPVVSSSPAPESEDLAAVCGS